MPNGINQVRPGEVISSELINYVLTQLQAMDERLSALEEGTPPGEQVRITGFEPPDEIPVGQELTIHGSNFRFPPAQNEVTFNSVAVPDDSFRTGSTSTQLKFIAPALPGVSLPAQVTVKVSNNLGATSSAYRLLPALPTEGDPPTIDTITNKEDGSTNLAIGKVAVIQGQNFGSTPEANTITFNVTMPGGTVTYPKPDQTLDIRSVNSEEIQVVVPDIAEVPDVNPIDVTIEVKVDDHPAAQHTNPVFRLSA